MIQYAGKNDLGMKLKREATEVLYLTKPGPFDGFIVPGVKNCVHAQFLCDEFHGDAYADLSSWMSRVMTGRLVRAGSGGSTVYPHRNAPNSMPGNCNTR